MSYDRRIGESSLKKKSKTKSLGTHEAGGYKILAKVDKQFAFLLGLLG